MYMYMYIYIYIIVLIILFILTSFIFFISLFGLITIDCTKDWWPRALAIMIASTLQDLQWLVNVPTIGDLLNITYFKFLLEMKKISTWVMWNIVTFSNP